MSKEFISYSSLLIDFIEPLITGDEDEDEFLDKLKLGQLAWNYSVADKNELAIDKLQKQLFLEWTKANEEAKELLNQLVLRKEMEYSKYNQFIFNVGIRKNKFGQKVFFAESAPADKI